MCLHVKGVDLFISRSGSESYELHVYVEDNYTCTIAHGFTYEAIVEFINFNISEFLTLGSLYLVGLTKCNTLRAMSTGNLDKR